MLEPAKWRLTPAQADTLDAICEHGRVTRAAASLGVAVNTARSHVACAMRKAEAESIVQLALAWDRYSRPAKKVAA